MTTPTPDKAVDLEALAKELSELIQSLNQFAAETPFTGSIGLLLRVKAALRECAAEQDSAKKRQLAQLIELKADTEMPLMGIVNNLKAENQSLRDQVAAYEPAILRIKQLQYAGIGDEPLVIVDTKRGPVPAALAALPEKDDG